jgi:hypothetical protein
MFASQIVYEVNEGSLVLRKVVPEAEKPFSGWNSEPLLIFKQPAIE